MNSRETPAALVFGANGELGSEIVRTFKRDGYSVSTVVRHPSGSPDPDFEVALKNSFETTFAELPIERFDAVVWAQGVNTNDSADDVTSETFDEIMEANLGFVVDSMSELARSGRLARPARLCVLSSIWEHLSRTKKFSYTISKAAIGGLVRAASADLAHMDVFVNAVLPGVVDTSMSRGVLSQMQIESVTRATGFGRLTTPMDVAETVAFLCSSKNGAITGQSLVVDLGFSHVRTI